MSIPIRLFITGALICLLLVGSGPAYSDEPLSLNSLTEEVKKNNPEILSAKKRWDASLARVPQARALDNPQIGFTLEKIPSGTLKLNETMPEDRMLSISQMVPFFGKLPLKKKIAVIESQMFAAEYKNKELEIINELKNGYYDLFMNYKEIELSEESLKLLKGIAKIAESKYAVGEIRQEELFKINLEIAKLSNDIANLNQEQLAKKTRINTILNREPENPLGIPGLEEDVSFHQDIDSLYKRTLGNQPELLIFSYAIERNKNAKSLTKKSYFPDMMAQIVQRGITSGSIGAWDIMLSFTVPLWFWTKQRYEVKEAIANLEEARAAYEAMKNRALSETRDLAAKIEIAKNKNQLNKTNLIPLLESSINASLGALRSGKGDLMELLDSERMLIETRMNYYKTLVEYNMSLADLEQTVGVELREVRR
ncbi:MAG: TolC family protein [Candidatus Omnitrophica bacterium]|nr:TolC family protein [Candidatus Omnitrophota bacterium]